VQRASGLPCALLILGARFPARLGRYAPREREVVFRPINVIAARSVATKQVPPQWHSSPPRWGNHPPFCYREPCMSQPLLDAAAEPGHSVRRTWRSAVADRTGRLPPRTKCRILQCSKVERIAPA